MPQMIEISVVIPARNEERCIALCVLEARRAIDALGLPGEVVVVDNASTDETARIAGGLGARVVREETLGYGSALRRGLAAAHGRYVFFADADGSYDFGELAAFVARLRAGADLVVGNRFAGGIEPGAMPPLHRFVGNPALTWIMNFFFRTPVRDSQCGMRALRRDKVDTLELAAPGMEFASEIIIKAVLARLHIAEVPIKLWPDNRRGPSHLRSFRDGFRHLRCILAYAI